MQYVPTRIETLLLAESPPTRFRVQPNRYFYAPGRIRHGALFYYTMSVLFEEEMRSYKNLNKEYFLNKFKDRGFYLVDMVKCPIDKLPRDEKTEAIESCAQYLRRELGALSFERIIVVGKGSFEIARRKLNLSFDPVAISLPLGSQRNVESYVEELKQYLMY
jgi:hypothetical protein